MFDMSIAIHSDIHGNSWALEAVLSVVIEEFMPGPDKLDQGQA